MKAIQAEVFGCKDLQYKPIQVRHMIWVIGATLALSGQKEARNETEQEGRDTESSHRHRELLSAVSATAWILDSDH